MPKHLDQNVAAWLRRQLRRRDWTQADLARKLGYRSTGRISEWVSGKRIPNPTSCDRLADVFGEDIDYVLTLAGHRPPDYNDHDPERAALMQMLQRVQLADPERRRVIRSILEDSLQYDQAMERK